ncbi:O-antigen ligase family protein [Thomasclavelia cocleata]|uniref:O-antigen ligase family protein n=1 Tax=Thomasclavelia cocleata TaxID=69824 RepID=UPI00242C5C93|nr:O-antigen ligase family protein [Thomasclavelia cocleata]
MIKKRTLKKSVPYILSFLIIIGVIFRPITILTFFLMILYILIEKDDSCIFAVLFFCLSFANAFKLSANSASLFTYVQLFFVIKLLFTKKYQRNFLIAIILYTVYIFIGMGNEYSDAIKQVSFPILIYCCMKPDVLNDTASHLKNYAFGVICSSIVGLFRDNIPNLITLVNQKVSRMEYEVYIDRFSGLIGDPNYYSINLILAFILIIFLYMKGKISSITMYVVCISIIIFGAMTGSKTFLLMLVIIFIFMLIEMFKHKKYITAIICTIIIIVGIVLVVSGKISIFNIVIERLNNATSISELTTERTDIWLMYTNNIFAHPLETFIGNGFGKGYTFNRYPHNTYLDFINILGICGIYIFLYTWRCAVSFYKRSKNLLNYIPLIIILMMYFSISMLSHYDMIYHIMLITLVIFFNEDNLKRINTNFKES